MKFWMTMACLFGMLPIFSLASSPVFDLNTLVHKDPSIDIGVSVINAKTGQSVFQYNAQQLFTPGSNAKVFTAYAAFIYLKGAYTYRTTLWMQTHPQLPMEDRNFYLQFSGDPSFTDQDLRALLMSLQALGIHHLRGNLVLVGDRFQLPDIAPGVAADDLFWHYGAPIDTIIINENQVPVRALPSEHLNQAVRFAFANPPIGVSLASARVNTVTFPTSMTDCSLWVHQTPENAISLGGCWPIHQPTLLSLAVKDPDYFAKAWVKVILAEMNIRLEGKILFGSLPSAKNLQVVAVHHSLPLSELLTTMLQKSDDVYANAILKTLGAEYYGVGSYQMGVKAMAHILMPSLPFSFRNMEIVDGAGLSRYNLISPLAFAQLFRAIYRAPNGQAFMQMLAGPGRPGTLQYSFPSLQGRLFAKTGTLEHASTLSGFLITERQTVLAFSIMINHVFPSPKRTKPLIGAILRCLNRDY